MAILSFYPQPWSYSGHVYTQVPLSVSYLANVTSGNHSQIVSLSYTLLGKLTNGIGTYRLTTNSSFLGLKNDTSISTVNLLSSAGNISSLPFFNPALLLSAPYNGVSSQYGISEGDEQVSMQFVKEQGLGNGNSSNTSRLTFYQYNINYFSPRLSYNGTMDILSSGVVYRFQGTLRVSNVSYNVLMGLSHLNISFENLSLASLVPETPQPSFIYAVKAVQAPYYALRTTVFLQLTVPIQYSNGVQITDAERIYPQASGSVIQPAGSGYIMELSVGNYTQVFTPYYPAVGGHDLTYLGKEYTLLNTTEISTPVGDFTAYVYNISPLNSPNGSILLFFSNNGMLLMQETLSGGKVVGQIELVSNNFYTPNVTRNIVPSNIPTTLPYKAVNPNLSLELAIAVPLVLVFIITLFYRRK